MHLSMKFMIALVKPFQLDEVLDALTNAGVQELTVTEVRAYGKQKGHKEFYRGLEYIPKLVPALKLEIAVSADRVAKAVETIARVTSGAEVFVFDLDQFSDGTSEAAGRPRRAA
jgi:nitrogen regulatory protein P-II 2